MMLSQMIAVEPGSLGGLQQGETVVIRLVQRFAPVVDVIEDAELHDDLHSLHCCGMPAFSRTVFQRLNSAAMC